jgi:hypothetical protein
MKICAYCWYLEERVPRVQASSQDNGSGSRLRVAPGPPCAPAAPDSSGAAMCPCDSGSRLLAQGSSRAVMCPEDRLYRLQAIKQISSDDPAIMISIRAHARVSFKVLHDEGCSALSQVV